MSGKRKTPPCRYFMSSGFCFYGENCQFSHSRSDGGQVGATAENPSTAPGILGPPPSTPAVPISPHPYAAVSHGGQAVPRASSKYGKSPHSLQRAGLSSSFSSMSLGAQAEARGPDPSAAEFVPLFMRRGNTDYPTDYSRPPVAPSTTATPTASMDTIGDARADIQVDNEEAYMMQQVEGGTTYFYSATDENAGEVPPLYFPGVPPYVSSQVYLAEQGPQSYFLASNIAEELLHRQMLHHARLPESADHPPDVNNYHHLYPLERIDTRTGQQFSSRVFTYPTNCYKATSSRDGLNYCLRHILGYRFSSTASMFLVERWKKLHHPSIVTLHEVFTSKAFGESSLMFIHDYHAGAETMHSRHFSNMSTSVFDTASSRSGLRGTAQAAGGAMLQPALSEALIWSYIVQLASAIRVIHNSNLACRIIHPTKIIFVGKSRLRLSSAGILDVLTFEPGHTDQAALMAQHQQEDLICLGRLILCLACNSLMAVQNFPAAMEVLQAHYTGDLKNIVSYLLSNQMGRSINNVMPMIGARFFSQVDALNSQHDLMEVELMKELQNSRLFRLICKLGVINERPEFNVIPSWSETGDRYLLKLFRDYLFHQVTEDGLPWLSLSHIVHCLNQLDAGSPEKVCLVSRDEQSVLIVSYHDLKRCFESTFQDVMAGAMAATRPAMSDGDNMLPS